MVTYALPLLAFTLLRHESVLRQQHGDEAFERALATCNAGKFFGCYLAPAVAGVVAACAAGVRLLQQQDQEADKRVEAAQQLPSLLDLEKLKLTTTRRNKPAEEKERLDRHIGVSGLAWVALHDGIDDGVATIDGIKVTQQKVLKEELLGMLITLEQRMLQVVPKIAATALKPKPSDYGNLDLYLRRLKQLLQPAAIVRTSWHSHAFPLSSRLAAELKEAAQLPELVQSRLADAFTGPLQELVRRVMEESLVEYVMQACCSVQGAEQEQQARAALQVLVRGMVAGNLVEEAVAKHVGYHLGGSKNGLQG